MSLTKVTLIFPLACIALLLLGFWEYLPLLRKPQLLQAAPTRKRWQRKDSLLCFLLTAAYAVVAFLGLGSTRGIESYCKFQERGEYALIELESPTEISAVKYYSAIHTGTYSLQFSDDGSHFYTVGNMNQLYSDLLRWNDATITEDNFGSVRAIRIIADQELWLGELVLYDGNGTRILPEALSYSEGVAPLFDEQEKVPTEQSYLDNCYFDEIYHARTALEHIENIYPYEITHPPLGKLILSLGIRLFGMVPFGWRFSGTLFGVLMLPAMYVFLKKMFGGSRIPAAGTAIFATDFMHFVQTRIATIDTYGVFFTILMYLFFWLYLQSDREKAKCWLPPLACSGICFGMGAACKWTGFYAGAGLAVLWFLDRVFRACTLMDEKKGDQIRWETLLSIAACAVFFVALPACIYYVSYWPYGTAVGLSGVKMLFTKDYLRIVLDNQDYMFSYHSGINATHPYSSVWWQWLLDVRPILYYLQYYEDGTRSSFGAFVNPLLCWGGLLAMLAVGYQAICKRDKKALFILLGYLAQLVPWVFVKRIVFEYHYFPGTVFLLLALGYQFEKIELGHPQPRRLIYSYVLGSVVLFAAFYPVLSGLRVNRELATKFLQWMGTWPF